MVYSLYPFLLNHGEYAVIRDVKIKEDIKCVEFSLIEKLFEDNFFAVGVYQTSDYRLIKANQKYCEYLNGKYNLDYLPIGSCIDEFAPDFKGSKSEKAWSITAEKGETTCIEELKTTSTNGIDNYWNCFNIPISEEGKVKYIIAMLNDITEYVLKRRFTEDKIAELERTIELKDELLLLITHELKTPLSVITSSIQIIESICKNEITEKLNKYLGKIRQNTYRQLKLVNNILDNTRVSSGHFKLKQTNVEIVALTGMIIDSIMVFAEKKKIKIIYSAPPERMVIKADVDQYERILLNLLSNAVKYTPEDRSVELIIFQLMKNDVPTACVQVKDQGVGIPNDKKDYIFERFGRVDKHMKNSEGTGIGLYLVKMLVAMMNGKIELESEEGEGSIFSLFFPLMYTEPAECSAAERPNEKMISSTAIEFSDIYYGL